MLSPESSAEPGRWHTSRVEAARGPMLAVTNPHVKIITIMSCTQLLKTEFINNIVGYFTSEDPCPMIVVQPTVKLGEAWSKDRLDKMIRDTPILKQKFSKKKSRDESNTILHKSFMGGHISIVGSNAPSDLASRPIRIVLCDEIDKYPASAGDEGDPIKLVSERSDTFWNALIIHTCSPTIENSSRINYEYEASDKRVFEIPCPHCNERAELKWSQVKWDDDKPATALYYCAECDKPWQEHERLKALELGTWRATAPFKGHAGFRVNKLASPWRPMSVLAEKFVHAKNNPELLKTFINTQLAETWKQLGESPEWKKLYVRREQYAIGTVPEGVVFLTSGIDVQADRLEIVVRGWGRNKISWFIDHRVFIGTTSNLNDACWQELESYINESFPSESGKIHYSIRLTAIDSGYNTQIVYSWCRKFPMTQVIAIKGQENQASIINQPRSVDVTTHGKTIKHGLKLWSIGVNLIKAEFYGWLKQDIPAENEEFSHGFCHFPQFNEEFFKQLTAEQMVGKISKGYKKLVWEKTRARNETLDAGGVYARAAAAVVGIDRFREPHWQRMELQKGVSPHGPKVKPKRKLKRRESTFL